MSEPNVAVEKAAVATVRGAAAAAGAAGAAEAAEAAEEAEAAEAPASACRFDGEDILEVCAHVHESSRELRTTLEPSLNRRRARRDSAWRQ
jgi:hypothetical protein